MKSHFFVTEKISVKFRQKTSIGLLYRTIGRAAITLGIGPHSSIYLFGALCNNLRSKQRFMKSLTCENGCYNV